MSELESKRRARLLAIIGSTLVSCLIAGVIWWAFGGQEEGPIIELYTVDEETVEELVQQVRTNESADPLGRTPLQAELAARLLKQKHHRNIFDEFANYVNDPNLEEKRRFKEHPKGEFTIRTNSLSLRRDTEATAGKIDLRVLITGDSHLEGTCNNSENLCSVAEASLKAERPGETIEVLNAGRGGYQLWNYVGILERYLSLDLIPDVFVVMVFGGNDFSGTCQMSHLFEGTRPKSLAPGYREKRQQAIEHNRPIMAQGYNSVLHFRDNPDEAEYTLNQIRRITAYMSTLCEENGVELLFLYLPAPLDLDWEPPFPNAAEIRSFLDISDEVKGVNGRIAADLLEDLSRASIPAVDLTPSLGVDPAKHFWEKDLHLSVAGHRVTGELLADAIRELRTD